MKKREMFITCTAVEFKQPVADQVIALLQRNPDNVDREYLYPMILLSVAMFEAYMVRARFLRLQKEKTLPAGQSVHKTLERNRKSGLTIFEELFPRCGKRRLGKLKEVFVLRDVLTHNHLWEWFRNEEGHRVVTHRLFGWDSKYKDVVAESNLPMLAGAIRTKMLGLPVVPGEQMRANAKTCFAVIWDALLFASKRMRRLNVSTPDVRVPCEILKRYGKQNHTVELNELVNWLE
jgi:hypothetical protein